MRDAPGPDTYNQTHQNYCQRASNRPKEQSSVARTVVMMTGDSRAVASNSPQISRNRLNGLNAASKSSHSVTVILQLSVRKIAQEQIASR